VDDCKPLVNGLELVGQALRVTMAPVAVPAAEAVAAVQAQAGMGQGLTLVHFSAQLKPCLTNKNTVHTLHTP
jgi:hypothetical protein